MRLNKLKYFVKRSEHSRVKKEVEFGYQPSDRDILSFMHENKPIKLGDSKYSVHDIYAEPSKKTIGFEMLVSVIVSFFLNIYFYNEELAMNFLICVCSAIIFGLVGIARIEKQKKMAEKFNNS